MNILSDLHEIITDELSRSKDGLIKFENVLQLSKYSFLSLDEERGILLVFLLRHLILLSSIGGCIAIFL